MMEEIKNFLENKKYTKLFDVSGVYKEIKFYKKNININFGSDIIEIYLKKLKDDSYILEIKRTVTDGNEEKIHFVLDRYINESEEFIKSRIALL